MTAEQRKVIKCAKALVGYGIACDVKKADARAEVLRGQLLDAVARLGGSEKGARRKKANAKTRPPALRLVRGGRA